MPHRLCDGVRFAEANRLAGQAAPDYNSALADLPGSLDKALSVALAAVNLVSTRAK